MRKLTFLFLLILVAEFILSGTENRHELFKLGVQHETVLDQCSNLNNCSGELAVVDFEEDEQEEAVFLYLAFNDVQGSSREGLNNVVLWRNSSVYPLPQAWLSRMSDSSPPA